MVLGRKLDSYTCISCGFLLDPRQRYDFSGCMARDYDLVRRYRHIRFFN
jgi:hypothetical protein